MHISNPWLKGLIGFSTFLVAMYPILFMAIFFLQFLTMTSFDFTQMDPNEPFFPPFFGGFFLFFPLMICISFLQMGLMAFYVVHIVKNRTGSEVLRILAGIGVYMLPFVAMPAYYLIYILPKSPPDWALEQS